MTDRDSAPFSGWPMKKGLYAGDPTPDVVVEIDSGFAQQFGDVLAAMVTSNVRMQVLPDALDAVVVRAVGRQEVQDDAIFQVGELAENDVCRVDDVIVDHQMDLPSARIARREQSQQLAKQEGILAPATGDVQFSGAHVERSSQVELLVLAGRHDSSLSAAKHPVAPDPRVQVDIDFVTVEDGLGAARASFEPADRCQLLLARISRPRAEHDGLGHAQSSTNLGEHTAHGTHGHQRPALALDLQAQQLPCPCRSAPADILWRATQQPRDALAQRRGDLRLTVVPALGVQPENPGT